MLRNVSKMRLLEREGRKNLLAYALECDVGDGVVGHGCGV